MDESLCILAMDLSFFFSLPLLLSLILFPVICLKLVRSFKSKRVKPSKLPPGPWRLPIIGSIHHLGGSLPHRRLRELSEKYGPVMWLQLGEMSTTVVISSAEAAKEVLKTKDHIFGQRPFLVGPDVLFYGPSDIFLSPTGDYWKLIKKTLSQHLLNAARVRSFQTVREDEVSSLVTCLYAKAGLPVNLTEKIFETACRIVSRSAFHNRREKKRNDDGQEQAMILLCQAVVSMTPDVADLFPSRKWLRVVTRGRRKYEDLHRRIDVLLENIIAGGDDAGEEEEEDCLLSALVNLKRYGDLTMDNVKAVLMDVVVAGYEPATRLVEWAMAEMVRKPRVLKKAQQEVRQVMKKRGNIDESGLEELEYLKAVIKETLRLHPPAPLLSPRECTKTCEINGYTIPEGTHVLVNVWAIGRNPKYWTSLSSSSSSSFDVEEFVPERFMDNSGDYRGSKFEFLPFGAGKRGCPGMLFGPAIGEILLANLLCHFDWQFPSGITPETLDMTELMGSTIRKKYNLILVPTPHDII